MRSHPIQVRCSGRQNNTTPFWEKAVSNCINIVVQHLLHNSVERAAKRTSTSFNVIIIIIIIIIIIVIQQKVLVKHHLTWGVNVLTLLNKQSLYNNVGTFSRSLIPNVQQASYLFFEAIMSLWSVWQSP